MSKPPRGVRWTTDFPADLTSIRYMKYLGEKGIKAMIKTVIKRICIIVANRNWKSKRRYLIKKGATIGAGTRLNCGVEAFGTEPFLITVGDDCLFAGGIRIITHDGGIKVLNSLNKFEGKRMTKMASVRIGNNVYIGQNAMILPGVSIGHNVIIGAGAIVTHDIPDDSVAVGIPATVKKNINEFYTTTVQKKLFCFEGKTVADKERILINEMKLGNI